MTLVFKWNKVSNLFDRRWLDEGKLGSGKRDKDVNKPHRRGKEAPPQQPDLRKSNRSSSNSSSSGGEVTLSREMATGKRPLEKGQHKPASARNNHHRENM